ncbi:protein-cysteine N-palmitoyltransferase HHAT [Elysia marginata]|uniref:Protein-cysteine N-palmitoyltransferase HHAT n=1 Tax=Elysia marginata TaxID=1093978 RepID=A0AAV4HJT3_9GAST|nr:protein-cysteine N-palmitoyltransferase HHAT [Elysia marginata]
MSNYILPLWEQWIYWVIGVSSIAYSWWRMYVEGNALQGQYLHHGFKENWTLFGRLWDISDPEWSLWRSKLGLHLGLCSTHIALSQACRLVKSTAKVRMSILVLCDLTCLCVILGPKALVYMLLKAAMVWITSHFGGVPGVWGVLSIEMIANNMFTFSAIQLGRLDGLCPPPEPRCISWVYSYTEMWKYFDTGLYNFIKVYVYIPLGGSRHGLGQQLAASVVVFLFIYVWHGGSYFLFIWCCGNFLVGSIEAVACAFEKTLIGQRLASVMGQKMMLRLKCFLFAPAYLASCLQTFFFLFHVQEAWEITERILFQTTWKQFGFLIGIFYACIHNAMFIREVFKCKKDIHKK